MSKGNALSQITKSAMAEFLSKKEWTHWVTLTTRSPLSLSSARRGVIRLVNILKIRVNFKECFFASEPFDCKVGYHIHMLINASVKTDNTDMLYEIRSSWREAMREPNARVSVSRYNPEENATGYISKYIQKWLSDYDYYTSFNNDKIGDGIEEWQRERKANNGQKSRDALQKLYKEFNYSVDDIRNLEYDVFENYYTKYKSDRDIETIENEINTMFLTTKKIENEAMIKKFVSIINNSKMDCFLSKKELNRKKVMRNFIQKFVNSKTIINGN
jgi:hypothetical protein